MICDLGIAPILVCDLRDFSAHDLRITDDCTTCTDLFDSIVGAVNFFDSFTSGHDYILRLLQDFLLLSLLLECLFVRQHLLSLGLVPHGLTSYSIEGRRLEPSN